MKLWVELLVDGVAAAAVQIASPFPALSFFEWCYSATEQESTFFSKLACKILFIYITYKQQF